MEGSPVRLFVALELPGGVQEALVGWRAPILGAEPGLRAVGTEGLHLTLCFLGSRPPDAVARVGAACEAVATRSARGLSLGEALWLPARRRPRVLAVRVEDPRAELAAVQARLASELAATGLFEPEQRAFLGHVTVARVRSGARVRAAELPKPLVTEFDGSTVTLFRSHLGRAGARYEPLHKVQLIGA